MIDHIECSSPEDYASKLQEVEILAANTNKPLFLLFYGTKNSDGRSWCPDCTAAEPVIEDILSGLSEGAILLSSSVDREPYRSPDYFYRKHASVKLTCVPTLIKWNNGKVLGRLNDSQSQVTDLVRELAEA